MSDGRHMVDHVVKQTGCVTSIQVPVSIVGQTSWHFMRRCGSRRKICGDVEASRRAPTAFHFAAEHEWRWRWTAAAPMARPKAPSVSPTTSESQSLACVGKGLSKFTLTSHQQKKKLRNAGRLDDRVADTGICSPMKQDLMDHFLSRTESFKMKTVSKKM